MKPICLFFSLSLRHNCDARVPAVVFSQPRLTSSPAGVTRNHH